MGIFRNGYWPGTFILMFLLLMVLFIVFCLLGLFVDPSMSQGTRGGIVTGWAAVGFIVVSVTFIGRHG